MPLGVQHEDRRLFLRHFCASCKRVPRSSGLGKEPGESDLAEIDRAGHHPASAERDAPAARARNLETPAKRGEKGALSSAIESSLNSISNLRGTPPF